MNYETEISIAQSVIDEVEKCDGWIVCISGGRWWICSNNVEGALVRRLSCVEVNVLMQNDCLVKTNEVTHVLS